MVLGLAIALEGFGDGSITTWAFLSAGDRAEESSGHFYCVPDPSIMAGCNLAVSHSQAMASMLM